LTYNKLEIYKVNVKEVLIELNLVFIFMV
jgi:hypothetical protein